MDLAYLRAHPQHLPTFLTHQRIRETPVGGGDVCVASRLTLDDGTSIFTKTWPSDDASRTAAGAAPGASAGTAAGASAAGETAGARIVDGKDAGGPPAGFFEAEAAGLEWLRSAGAVPVPEVIVALPNLIALEWVEPGAPSAAGAEELGRSLAALHRTGADAFGADWPGFIGPLSLDNTPSTGAWGPWFAQRRLLPYLRTSADRGALPTGDIAAVERIIDDIDAYGGGEPPSRTHGDLWPGNVLWAADGRGWLVDPAAQGAHRETDLAELALFGGAPHLDRILAAYEEVHPLSDGWRERVPLHQLHLLLVHTAVFGAAFGEAVHIAAAAVLRS